MLVEVQNAAALLTRGADFFTAGVERSPPWPRGRLMNGLALTPNRAQSRRMGVDPVSTGRVRRLASQACQLVMVMQLAGCTGELDPCPGVAMNTGFEIEVIGPSAPEQSCHEAWGLGAGVVVEGRIAELSGDDDCRSGVPEIEAVGDWSWAREPSLIRGGYTLEASYVVSRAECSARLWWIVSSEPGLGCDASRGDQCELEARITPLPRKEALCPALCSGRLEVRARRL